MLLLTLICLLPLGTPALLRKSFLRIKQEETLVLAHILFRHGDRTPISSEKFPNNPYINDTFPPYGIGQLTLDGKRRSYDLGSQLRRRYNKFLGPVYYIDLIEAVSTEVDRTIMSLQAVLAGMFPPTGRWKLKRNLYWQPVLYKYLNAKEDLLLTAYSNCPSLLQSEVNHDEDALEIMDYLSAKTGGNITSIGDVLGIQNILQVLEELGRKLPEWVAPIWPEPLSSFALQFWSDLVDEKLPQISGKLIEKINEDTAKKINGTLSPKDRKIFMYSGHDINVVGLLGVLGLYDGCEINYSAYIILELHKINDVYGMKVFFANEDIRVPELMNITNCGTFCPFAKFVEITKKFYLSSDAC